MIKGFPSSSDGKESAYNEKTRVRSLGWEDPLEKEMATHSSILALKMLWMEEPGGLQSMGSRRVGHDWVTNAGMIKQSVHQEIVLEEINQHMFIWGDLNIFVSVIDRLSK